MAEAVADVRLIHTLSGTNTNISDGFCCLCGGLWSGLYLIGLTISRHILTSEESLSTDFRYSCIV